MAAGVVKKRCVKAPYTTTIRWNDNDEDDDEGGWIDDITAIEKSTEGKDNRASWKRTINLHDCNLDVDSVDASYSLDQRGAHDLFPMMEWTGLTKDDLDDVILCIEHCLNASNGPRFRTRVLYGGDDERLLRVLVCAEQREKQQRQPQNRYTT